MLYKLIKLTNVAKGAYLVIELIDQCTSGKVTNLLIEINTKLDGKLLVHEVSAELAEL